MKTHIIQSLAFAAILQSTVVAAPPTVDLFNGKDLSGWNQRGGTAKYTIENRGVSQFVFADFVSQIAGGCPEQAGFVKSVGDSPLLLVRNSSGQVTRIHLIER